MNVFVILCHKNDVYDSRPVMRHSVMHGHKNDVYDSRTVMRHSESNAWLCFVVMDFTEMATNYDTEFNN